MAQQPARDPVPPVAHAVLDLFRSALAEVRFPDVDRASLDAAERALLDAQLALEDAEAALERARAAVAAETAALSARAQRALAYARVFAESDPALRAEVDAVGAVGLPSSRRDATAAPAPRRARKKKSDEATLFEETTAPAEPALQ